MPPTPITVAGTERRSHAPKYEKRKNRDKTRKMIVPLMPANSRQKTNKKRD